jgi:hypothetical protein
MRLGALDRHICARASVSPAPLAQAEKRAVERPMQLSERMRRFAPRPARARGVRSFGHGQGPGGPMYAINVRCLDGVDIASLKITPVDGKRSGAAEFCNELRSRGTSASLVTRIHTARLSAHRASEWPPPSSRH